MPTEITVQNLEVQNNKLVVTPQTVEIPDATDIETTPLASVPESASADTVIVIKGGVPRQVPVSDLKTDMGVPTSADEISFDPDKAAYLTETNVQDAIDEVYDKTRRRGGHSSESVACTTGMTLLRTITNLPSGYKIVNAELWYNASSPVELCMSTNQQYSNIAHASNTGVTKTLQVLTCTGMTSATTIYIYGKSGAEGNNNVAFNWCLAFEE